MLKPAGTLIIDAGAARALADGKSLLPAGIRQIDGRLRARRRVLVKDQEGRRRSRVGWPPMASRMPERIAGKRTADIEAILGYRGRDEMIHRDDLALTVS